MHMHVYKMELWMDYYYMTSTLRRVPRDLTWQTVTSS